jgi:hypothetical protein
MTEEVGVVTGDLEVPTRLLAAEDIEVTVRYAGAEEWYTVEGSPIQLVLLLFTLCLLGHLRLC